MWQMLGRHPVQHPRWGFRRQAPPITHTLGLGELSQAPASTLPAATSARPPPSAQPCLRKCRCGQPGACRTPVLDVSRRVQRQPFSSQTNSCPPWSLSQLQKPGYPPLFSLLHPIQSISNSADLPPQLPIPSSPPLCPVMPQPLPQGPPSRTQLPRELTYLMAALWA